VEDKVGFLLDIGAKLEKTCFCLFRLAFEVDIMDVIRDGGK